MGRRAYGWTAGPAEDSEVIDAEAKELHAIVREIDPALEYPKSLKQVCRELNDRKVPTSEGGEWSVTPLARLLKNPRLIGRRMDKLGRPIMQGDLAYPPIFFEPQDVERWKRVRAVLIEPRRRQGMRGKPALASGHIVCGVCEASMYPTNPKTRAPRYACHTESGCGKMSIQGAVVDNHLAHVVVDRAALVVPGVSQVAAAAWWAAADFGLRRQLVDGLLDQVKVNPMGAGVTGAGRLELTWQEMPAWPASLLEPPPAPEPEPEQQDAEPAEHAC